MNQNFLDFLPQELKNIATEFKEIIINRSFKRLYQSFSEEEKVKIAQLFNSDKEQDKIQFLKTNLNNLKTIIQEETQKLLRELKQQ